MKVDVFIPTSNRLLPLTKCLNSMKKQTNNNFFVYIGSLREDDGVRNLLNQFKSIDINYFVQTKPGIIGAANEALEMAKNEIFVRIDDDVILDKEWVENIIKIFQSDKEIGGVTGPTIISDKGLESRDLTAYLNKASRNKSFVGKMLNLWLVRILYKNRILEASKYLDSGVFTLGSNFKACLKLKGNQKADYLEACNMAVRRKLLLKIGGFDETFLKGLGDCHEADVGMKVRKLGYKLVFNSKVKLEHRIEFGKVEAARPKSYYRIQNFVIFYHRHFPIKSIKQFVLLVINICIQEAYYFYKFISTGSINQLGAFPGLVVGLYRAYILNR